MIFSRKIPCYVLIFEQTEIIEKTLSFLCNYADILDIIITENPSDNSPAIKKIVDRFGEIGLIKRHYLLERNITGNALATAIEPELRYIKRHKYVMVTDGDITVDDRNWLKQQKAILQKHRDVFTCGVSLDMSNLPLKTFPEATGWIPDNIAENKDYFEAYTGVHLLLMRSKDLIGFMNWKTKNDLSFVDGNLHKYCYEIIHKKWARTKQAKAYHLTWDLYQDKNHPYTKFKLAKSFQKTWYHQMTSDYLLNEY